MKKIKHYILSLFALTLLMSPVSVALSPIQQLAATCNVRVLTFPAWYNGLKCDAGNKNPQLDDINNVWIVALNIVEWFVIAAGYLAAGYIIWAGFKYMKAQGDPGKISEAKNAITYAVIGLVIALLSVAIVQYVQGIVR